MMFTADNADFGAFMGCIYRGHSQFIKKKISRNCPSPEGIHTSVFLKKEPDNHFYLRINSSWWFFGVCLACFSSTKTTMFPTRNEVVCFLELFPRLSRAPPSTHAEPAPHLQQRGGVRGVGPSPLAARNDALKHGCFFSRRSHPWNECDSHQISICNLSTLCFKIVFCFFDNQKTEGK